MSWGWEGVRDGRLGGRRRGKNARDDCLNGDKSKGKSSVEHLGSWRDSNEFSSSLKLSQGVPGGAFVL